MFSISVTKKQDLSFRTRYTTMRKINKNNLSPLDASALQLAIPDKCTEDVARAILGKFGNVMNIAKAYLKEGENPAKCELLLADIPFTPTAGTKRRAKTGHAQTKAKTRKLGPMISKRIYCLMYGLEQPKKMGRAAP